MLLQSTVSPPYFSIIVPSLNSAATIERCIFSIISQTFTSFEVIFADGDSSDATIRLIRSFNDDRFYVESCPDRGIFDGMSRGICQSSGQWLLILGSDDELFSPHVLEQAHNLLSRYASGCLTASYGNAFIRGGTGWAEDGDTYMGRTSLQRLIKRNICQQAIFYRGVTIRRRELQFHKHLDGNGGDHFCNVRLWLIQPFVYIPMTVCIFHAGGASSFNRSQFHPSELLKTEVWPQDRQLSARVHFARLRLLLAWKLPILYQCLSSFSRLADRIAKRIKSAVQHPICFC